jgi:hypothetical protein
MTKLWWMYVTAFLAGIGITVMGMIQGDFQLVVVGVVIGIGLYFSRNRLN